MTRRDLLWTFGLMAIAQAFIFGALLGVPDETSVSLSPDWLPIAVAAAVQVLLSTVCMVRVLVDGPKT